MQTAWKHIRRSPYQALTATFIMSLTFFVATLLLVLTLSSSNLLKYYETRPQVIAYLKKDATNEKIENFKNKLLSDSRIEGVNFVSKDQALDIYKQATANNPLLSEFVSPKVFPASLEFSVTNLNFAKDLIEEIQKADVIDEVAFTANLGDSKNLNQVVERLNKVSSYIRITGSVIVAFLLASSLLVLLIITSMRIATRREEIEILQLLGATSGFIRMPFLLEGIIYAVFGALIGWLVALILTLYLSPQIVTFFGVVPFLPTKITDLLALFGVIFGVEIIIATFLGVLGSLLALGRYLKI